MKTMIISLLISMTILSALFTLLGLGPFPEITQPEGIREHLESTEESFDRSVILDEYGDFEDSSLNTLY
jgi:hypothetical protein